MAQDLNELLKAWAAKYGRGSGGGIDASIYNGLAGGSRGILSSPTPNALASPRQQPTQSSPVNALAAPGQSSQPESFYTPEEAAAIEAYKANPTPGGRIYYDQKTGKMLEDMGGNYAVPMHDLVYRQPQADALREILKDPESMTLRGDRVQLGPDGKPVQMDPNGLTYDDREFFRALSRIPANLRLR